MSLDSIVEVLIFKFKKGQRVSVEEMEDFVWLGYIWESNVKELPPKEEGPEEVPTVLSVYQDPKQNLEVLEDCVAFRFTEVSEGRDECYGSSISALRWECGDEDTFRGYRETFLEMAGEFTDKGCVRILTLWSSWTYDDVWNGDFECGVKLVGQFHLSQINCVNH